MHWLQALDTNLFLFINRTLANSFFDWLMPLLSGNALFIPLAVLTVLGVLGFGSPRARLCALMIFLVVALGDPLIINTIKKSVQRPRPFVVLPEARLYGSIGKGYVAPPPAGSTAPVDTSNHNSMPSSHAANWAAITTVMFLFYRRSLRFMLPLALGVGYSRIYNGMHYPSDVLTGAILGCGYALAGLVALQSIWNIAGKKWFPCWYAQLPSLLAPEPGPIPVAAGNGVEWIRLGYLLTFIMLIGRWIYLASGTIQLSEDEAYQWIWSKHLALSYYSKGPGIAWIQFLGTALFGDTELGVRFCSPLFTALLSLLLLRFLAREISPRVAFWMLLITNATPLLGVGTILMTIDPPLVLCWTWAMVAGWRALQPEARTSQWLLVGLAMGLGFLCKYTAACQLVCWALWFALSPASRVHLRKPGPWLALLVFLICTLPVVIWNAQHHWITITHVAGDAGMHSQWHPTLRFFWDFVFSELLLLNPVFFIGALWAAIGFWKVRQEQPLWRYFFCMGTPLFLGYWLFSFHSRVLPNWIAAAILPMFCLMLAYWRPRIRLARPFLVVALLLGFLVMAFMYQSNLLGKLAGNSLPGEVDPQRRVRAWPEAGEIVEAARQQMAAQGRATFIIAGHYGLTGLLTFYSPAAHAALQQPQPLVYCIDSDEAINQFYFWPEYDYRAHRQGQDAIYVSELDVYPLENGWFWKWLKREPIGLGNLPPSPRVPARIANEFESVTDLGDREVKIGPRVFHRVHLWECHHLK